MLYIKHTEVSGFESAIRGMRNSWESHDRSDSYHDESNTKERSFQIGKADLDLAMRLSRAGSDHGKYLRQIHVVADIVAPEKWWSEFDTYKVGTTANSTSMMHTLGRDSIKVGDFSFEDVDEDMKQSYMELINTARKRWVQAGKKKPSSEWRQMIMLTSVGFNYTRTTSMNYEVLKNIYHSRKNHRLSEWQQMCDWIETLPYSEMITLK